MNGGFIDWRFQHLNQVMRTLQLPMYSTQYYLGTTVQYTDAPHSSKAEESCGSWSIPHVPQGLILSPPDSPRLRTQESEEWR